MGELTINSNFQKLCEIAKGIPKGSIYSSPEIFLTKCWANVSQQQANQPCGHTKFDPYSIAQQDYQIGWLDTTLCEVPEN